VICYNVLGIWKKIPFNDDIIYVIKNFDDRLLHNKKDKTLAEHMKYIRFLESFSAAVSVFLFNICVFFILIIVSCFIMSTNVMYIYLFTLLLYNSIFYIDVFFKERISNNKVFINILPILHISYAMYALFIT